MHLTTRSTWPHIQSKFQRRRRSKNSCRHALFRTPAVSQTTFTRNFMDGTVNQCRRCGRTSRRWQLCNGDLPGGSYGTIVFRSNDRVASLDGLSLSRRPRDFGLVESFISALLKRENCRRPKKSQPYKALNLESGGNCHYVTNNC